MNKVPINGRHYASLVRMHAEQTTPYPSGFSGVPLTEFLNSYSGSYYENSGRGIAIFHSTADSGKLATLFMLYDFEDNVSVADLSFGLENHMRDHPLQPFLHILPLGDVRARLALEKCGFVSGRGFVKYFYSWSDHISLFLKTAAASHHLISQGASLGWLLKSFSELTTEDIYKILRRSLASPFRLMAISDPDNFFHHRVESSEYIAEGSRYIFDSEGECIGYVEVLQALDEPQVVRLELSWKSDDLGEEAVKAFLHIVLSGTLMKLYTSELEEVQVVVENDHALLNEFLKAPASEKISRQVMVFSGPPSHSAS